jgi:hypothetical protein
LISASLDERYRTVVPVAGGLWKSGANRLPEISHPNFAPYTSALKLLVGGCYKKVHLLEIMSALVPFLTNSINPGKNFHTNLSGPRLDYSPWFCKQDRDRLLPLFANDQSFSG